MNKVPVLATIREAYRFVFVNLGAIIALIWLPMLVVKGPPLAIPRLT